MCSGSEAGSCVRRIDFVYHSTLGLRVIKNKKKARKGGPGADLAARDGESGETPPAARNLSTPLPPCLASLPPEGGREDGREALPQRALWFRVQGLGFRVSRFKV